MARASTKGVKGRPEDFQAKRHQVNADRLSSEYDRTKVKLGELMGKMNAIEEQMAGLQAPQPVQPTTQNENLISGGVGILASLLGARPQFVQGGLDAYRGTKQDQAGRKDQQNLAAYQQQMNALKAQLSGLGREAGMQQDQMSELLKSRDQSQRMADSFTGAGMERANQVYDANQRYDQQRQLAELKSPEQRVMELTSMGVPFQQALDAIYGKQFEGAGRGEYLAGKNAADIQNTNTRAKTALDVAEINADARIRASGIAADAATRRAIIAGEYQNELARTKAGTINVNDELKRIGAQIAAIDKEIAAATKAGDALGVQKLRVAKQTLRNAAQGLRGNPSGPIVNPHTQSKPKATSKQVRPMAVDPAKIHGLLGK